MSLLDNLECAEKEPMSPEEETRLAEIALIPCPFCAGKMTIGEDEYLGYCSNCWSQED